MTIHYLQMNSPDELLPSAPPAMPLEVRQVEIPLPALNQFLYQTVGGAWNWHERLVWTLDRWRDYLNRPELQTWLGYVRGTPVGYFELESQPNGDVEIVYFGLLPDFTGKKLGGAFLTNAIQRAWQTPGARRVWVHTCTEDHPGALPNYQARGFKLYKSE